MSYSLNGVDPSPEADDGLQVLSEDSDHRFCRAWHLGTNGDPRSVLVVLPAAEHPAPTILERLAHEYSLRDYLDAAWAARPFELLSEHGRRMLLLEDPGGEPLEPLLSGPIEVGRFPRIGPRRERNVFCDHRHPFPKRPTFTSTARSLARHAASPAVPTRMRGIERRSKRMTDSFGRGRRTAQRTLRLVRRSSGRRLPA
jgi:hypothetical protein